MFERLCHAMGCPELATNPRYACMHDRVAQRDEVNAIVAAWVGSHTRDDLMRVCLEAEVPCGPINTIADIFADPHYQARENLVRVPDPELGEIVIPSIVPRLSLTPGKIDHLGRHKGVDTEKILRDWLGLDSSRIAELRAREII
jgi:crotonobetainyl-CoA:carnitine CoA-transferase CaiB-like acyl-CoA transferase